MKPDDQRIFKSIRNHLLSAAVCVCSCALWTSFIYSHADHLNIIRFTRYA